MVDARVDQTVGMKASTKAGRLAFAKGAWKTASM